jgi:hypothetical protein
MPHSAPARQFDPIAARKTGQHRIARSTLAAGVLATMSTLGLVGVFAEHSLAGATTSSSNSASSGGSSVGASSSPSTTSITPTTAAPHVATHGS